MKSGCVATMLALKYFIETHPTFKVRSYRHMFRSRKDLWVGYKRVNRRWFLDKVDFSIVTEPSAGFTASPFPVVCLGARGGYGLDIEFFGKSAHAALPEKGKNAALDAAKVICELENINYIVDEHLGRGDACVVAVESDGGACSVPDYARVKFGILWWVKTKVLLLKR